MSGSKSLTFFAYRFFRSRISSRLPKGMENLVTFSAIEGKRKRGVFFCRTMRVKVKYKIIPTSVDQSPGPEVPSRSKKEMPREERLPEERRRVSVSGLLRGRRLEEMT